MRLRAGDWVLLLGTAGLTVLLFLDWFSPGITGSYFDRTIESDLHATGWTSLGWGVVLLVAITLALSAALLVMLAVGVGDDRNVKAGVWLAVLAPVTLLVLLLRVLVVQPGLGLSLPNGAVDVEPAGYLGLLAAAVLVLGSWLSLHDERTTAPDRAFTPPEPRPAPPAT